MKKRLIRGFVLLFATLLIVAGCGTDKTEGNKPIKIAINQWPGYAYAYIAQEKGFFEKNNVKVEFVFDKEYSKTQERYKNGEVDGISEVFSDTIFHNSEGLKTKAVYITDYSDSGDVIIGKSSLNSLADLKGKKVGVDGINSFSHLFVLAVLEKAGLKESEIQIENIPAQDVLISLESGKIEAGHTWEPTKSAALKKGYKQLGKAGDITGIITDVLAFNDKVIQERPKDIEAIVKSMIEAKDFLDKNPEEAIKIMAEKEEMSEEDMKSGLDGVHQPGLEENLEAMKAGGYLYSSGELVSNFYLERGQMSKKPNLNEIIEPRFLNEIR